MSFRKLVIWMIAIGSVVRAGCSVPGAARRTCDPVAFDRVATQLAACLSSAATPQQAQHQLAAWNVLDDHWGAVRAVDLLAGGRPELLLFYHANPAQASWNPQGKMAVLQQQDGGWRVVVETPTPGEVGDNRADSLAGNWQFTPVASADVSGDGVDDLLFLQQWSNGTHGFMRFAKLLTADGAVAAPLAVVLIDDGTRPVRQYALDDGQVSSLTYAAGKPAITRTLNYQDRAFEVVATTIDATAATHSVVTADGARWSSFEAEAKIIYRQQADRLTLFNIADRVTHLKIIDGRLYVGGQRGQMWRFDDNRFIDVLATQFGVTAANTQSVVDFVYAAADELWVATHFQTVRYRPAEATAFDAISLGLLPLPDGSVWAWGWDGRAASNCCFHQFAADEVVSYGFAEPLPLSAAAAALVHALRPKSP